VIVDYAFIIESLPISDLITPMNVLKQTMDVYV